MKIKTWQERLDETTQGVDWITAHTIQIKFMKSEIDELRDTLQVKSGMWCGIEKKWQEKYEALLRGTPASAWVGVDDGLPIEEELVLTVGSKRVGMAVMQYTEKDRWQIETAREWNSAYPPTHWQPLPTPPGEQK